MAKIERNGNQISIERDNNKYIVTLRSDGSIEFNQKTGEVSALERFNCTVIPRDAVNMIEVLLNDRRRKIIKEYMKDELKADIKELSHGD